MRVERIDDVIVAKQICLKTARYVDEVALPNLCFGVNFASPHAHAPIKHVDVCKAKATPGVLLVLTGDHDKRDQLGGFTAAMMPADLGAPKRTSASINSVHDRISVRFVGDRIAFVVAQALAQARDAAELVEVD